MSTSTTPSTTVEAPALPAMRVAIMFGLNHITFNPDSAPDDATCEVIRVLRDLAQRIEDNMLDNATLAVGDHLTIRDINGNRIGIADIFKN